MALRKGKTRTILQNSVDSALMAVETYNKPRSEFRVENFIILMIIAWTKLFHAHFQNTIGEKYFYKDGHRYKIIDGERKAWELKECIRKYGRLSEPAKKNLEFFIAIRNKIEHRYLECSSLDMLLFGECQSLLFNYENLLTELFGDEYSLNSCLAYALQFSHIRSKEQQLSQKKLLSKEVSELKNYIDKYRSELSQEIYDSNEYSIKLIQVPKISNTNRSDLAVEFVNWNSLNEEDRQNYEQVSAIIKDKVVKKNVYNLDLMKPSAIIAKLNNEAISLNTNHHTSLWKCFKVRPANNTEDKFDTIDKYCIYDEVHNDYVYTKEWIDFIKRLFQEHGFTSINLRERTSQQLNISDYI